MIKNFLVAQISRGDINLPNESTDVTTATFTTILSIVFAIFGAVAVIVITVAGLRYVISQGNPQAVAQAKNTIIYALIGLILSISAFAIVNFVISRL